MGQELKMHEKQHTWDLVIPPENIKVISNKWVYSLKIDNDGKIRRYKARIVAKGCARRGGIDYEETFSPVVDFTLIRMMLTITSLKGWEARHLDINCAYLYGTLNEQIYMKVLLLLLLA